MKRSKRILLVTAILGITLGLVGCNKAEETTEYSIPEEKKLLVYTSHKPEIYEPIVKEFEERSGIWVEVVQGGSNEILNRIASGEEADIMFGGGVDSLEIYKDYFKPYRVSCYDLLDSTYASKDDSYTVFSRLPIVIVYNDKLVISAGRPHSFEELLSSNWKGKISFADPNLSGSSYTALVTMIQALSDKYSQDEVIELFRKNLAEDVYEGSGESMDAVLSGKKMVGITLEEAALKKIALGESIGIEYPAEGTSFLPDGCAILKSAKHTENAELFMEFVVSEDVQNLLEDCLNRKSVRTDIASEEEAAEMDYDIAYAISNREEILKKWQDAGK